MVELERQQIKQMNGKKKKKKMKGVDEKQYLMDRKERKRCRQTQWARNKIKY